MTDRELLELASKAAGIEFLFDDINHCGYYSKWRGLSQWNDWNPLTDDGDALRLAVELNLNIDCDDECVRTFNDAYFFKEEFSDGKFYAVRKSIVRAAAEIGKTK